MRTIRFTARGALQTGSFDGSRRAAGREGGSKTPGAAYAADSLLRGGSHLNIRNSMGDTALDVARQFMAAPPPGGSYELHAEIIQMLNALEEEYTRAKQRKQKKQKKTTTTEKEL